MKKITSMFLALVMALSLAVPAFASSGTVKVEGSIQMPTINVVLPTTASMVLNPYSMDVKLNPKDTTTYDDQVISPVMEVKNMSNIDMQVGIQIAGTKGKGDVKFATAAPAANAANKEAFIYAVFQIGAAGMTITDPGNVTADAANVAILDEPASGAAAATPKDVTNFETVAGAAADDDNTLAATVLNTTTNKQEAAPTGVLGFRFFGSTSDVTTWTEKDTLGATLTFKFTPVANAAGGGTPATPSVSAAITSGTPAAGANLTLTATPANIDASKNPTYSWAVTTDTNSIVDSFVDGNAATQTVNIAAGATSGQSATLTVTVTYDDAGSQDATVTDTVTITIT